VRLSQLIAALAPTAVAAPADPEIAGLHVDSRTVRPGGLFVAVRGLAADGHDFVADALARGAAAVVCERPVATGPAARILVADGRRALAALAARFYGDPSAAMTVVAVTGTNGKTTTTYLVEGILAAAGLPAGVIGTINTRFAGRTAPSPVTTPESLDLQRTLAEMRAAGIGHAVIEASSHAIALERIRGCWMDVAVFTNLTQDHLDFHGDMEAYGAVKRRLFTEHLAAGPKAGRAAAVINTDHPAGRALADSLAGRVLRVGRGADTQVTGLDFRCDPLGIHGTIAHGAARIPVASGLIGRHNVENILCAAGAALALGIPAAAVAAGIEAVGRVPGRLDRVPDPAGRFVYVDYAHTPDALENALTALRAIGSGRLLLVFGCGGDRDRTKRPLMGAIAGRLSDVAVVTSDNPRSEDPHAVIAEILPGLRASGRRELAAGRGSGGYLVVADRRRAIALAVGAARRGDMVLIAGKGHETYQIIGGKTLPFDDAEAAAAALAAAPPAETAEGAARDVGA
jgi:UDP-N-acetylmuramyl-tripeptide synthetase